MYAGGAEWIVANTADTSVSLFHYSAAEKIETKLKTMLKEGIQKQKKKEEQSMQNEANQRVSDAAAVPAASAAAAAAAGTFTICNAPIMSAKFQRYPFAYALQ